MDREITQEMIDDFQSDLWSAKMNYIEDRGQAKYLLNLGYRKADEVRKETAKELLTKLQYWNKHRDTPLVADLLELADDYGIELEVDE